MAPVASHQLPGVSPGAGIIALTRISSFTRRASAAIASAAIGAVKPPSDWATRTTSSKSRAARTTRSAYSGSPACGSGPGRSTATARWPACSSSGTTRLQYSAEPPAPGISTYDVISTASRSPDFLTSQRPRIHRRGRHHLSWQLGEGERVVERVGEQPDEGLELYVDRRADLLVGPVESAGGEAGLLVDELGDARVDRLRGDHPPGRDGLVLTDAVDAVDRLCLLRRGPGQLGQHDVGRDLQVDADARGEQRADRDVDARVVDERVDALLPQLRRLVTADRRVADAASLEHVLGCVHHVDVLGEEDDLAGVARQLRGVVRGELGLRLADAAHHAEHVLAVAVVVGFTRFARAHLTDDAEVNADELRCVLARRDGTLITLDESTYEPLLGFDHGLRGGAVELDRHVGDAPRGDVGRDLCLAATHDAHVDDG